MTNSSLKYAVKFRKKQSLKSEFENWSNSELVNYILELRKEIESLNKEINSVNSYQKSSSNTSTTLTNKGTEYNQKWSLPTKIVFLLELKQQPLLTFDIHQLLLQFDKHYKKLNNPKKTLSSVLAQTFKTKRLLKFKRAGIKEMLVALPEWVNTDGSLKPKI